MKYLKNHYLLCPIRLLFFDYEDVLEDSGHMLSVTGAIGKEK
jgi:hypothetical protein